MRSVRLRDAALAVIGASYAFTSLRGAAKVETWDFASKYDDDNNIFPTNLTASHFSRREVARCLWRAYINRAQGKSNDSETVSPYCEEPFTVARPIRPRFAPKNNSQKQAAICAVHAGGERYIDEWTDYHLALGFQHMYIYDNSPTFALQEWSRLKQTEEEGRVQVFHGPGRAIQKKLYGRCLKQIRKQQHPNITWMATIDMDEFIILRNYSNIVDFLETYLSLEEAEVGSLSINWVVFYGTAFGYEPLPVTRRCQQRLPGNPVNQHIKRISKVEAVKEPLIHHDKLKGGLFMKDTAGHMFAPQPQNKQGQTIEQLALIYHFWSMSLEEFFSKSCIRGRATMAQNTYCKEFTFQHYLERMQSFNTTDDSAWKSLTHLLPEYREFDLIT